MTRPERIVRMFREGTSVANIARTEGITKSRVYQILDDQNVERPRRRGPQAGCQADLIFAAHHCHLFM
jgi:DNA invertase Pin-like site-specific DNA recombinase